MSNGIEIEKLWNFEFPECLKNDYLKKKKSFPEPNHDNDVVMENVEVHSPSTFRFAPHLEKISSKSTDNDDEKAILDSFKETNVDSIINTSSSFSQKIAERIKIMRLLYKDMTHIYYCEEYVKVAKKHYVYEKNLHNNFFIRSSIRI